MIICTQYTNEYEQKAEKLIDSVVGVDCIGVKIDRSNVESFRTDWPTNRENYCTMQAGEFVDYLPVPDDEIIICLDADTIMQREMTHIEKISIEAQLKDYDILSVQGAYPGTRLDKVLRNLGCEKPIAQVLKDFPGVWVDKVEFTASFMIARKSTFRKLAFLYNTHFDKMTKLTGHHAGGQWLINWVSYKYMRVGILPVKWQCGAWYDGAYMDNVIFNHTK